MLKKKLQKFGDSQAAIIPKIFLQIAGITDFYKISMEGPKIIIEGIGENGKKKEQSN